MTTVAAPAQRRHAPILYIVGGIGFLLFWLLCLTTQIQTSEAFLMGGGQVNIFHPDWSIFMQIPNIFLGNLSQQEAKAAVYAWAIEWLFLGIFLGWDEMKHAVSPTGKFLSGLFEFVGLGIVAYNFIADFNFGTLGTGFWGQVGFAMLTSFVVMFFAAAGVHFIRLGLHRTA